MKTVLLAEMLCLVRITNINLIYLNKTKNQKILFVILQINKRIAIMNKDILTRNIENVIAQPSYTMYYLKTMPNGVSEDGRYIMVQVAPDDSSWKCDLVDKDDNVIDFVGNILNMLPQKYREHLVTLEHDGWLSYSYRPVFDTDTQKMWDDSTNSYIKLKQEWCEKYGCD